ncbi:hypothetical protein H2200_008540 [Cladophialophora chaetospira]|uniref:Heterokaryon incompatibility domain-containing protein n=1 Tax=Cladophialophora chaetospira TaxID=386627 RepID=A0AA39CFS7_9EURO|nr:hypothetical protein H2200_008540 [Cladophialophora chaetospira]
MDHLQEIGKDNRAAASLPIQVPYLCQYEYDQDCDFAEYPAKRGFEKSDFLALDFNQRPPRETAAFLQTWLYFGLLIRLLRIPLSTEDFVDRSSGAPIITTRKSLSLYLERWAKKVRAKYVQEVEADLEEARSHVMSLLRAGDACPLTQEVVLSMMVLGATLSFAIDLKIESFPPKNKTVIADWGMSPLVTERLLHNGWCINDVHRLCNTVSVPTALVASILMRQEVVRKETHNACSPNACIARNIDGLTYHTQHVKPGCQCCSITAPVDQIEDILVAGDIPVVLIKEDAGGKILGLEAVSSRKTKFVAISHVWADGLGCPRATHCQPVSSCAIDMSTTYAEADKVLLLDSELLQLSKDVPEREILLRLIGSSWDRRVWTMQEGALGASGLQVKLADGLLDVADAIKRLQKSAGSRSLATAVIDRDATIVLEEFEQLQRAHSKSHWRDGVPAMAASLRILNGRPTSKEGDAYICLAGMMALKSDIIKDLDATALNERTRKLLSSVPYLPKNIIFSPGPKLKEEGYRWACASFWKSKFTFNDLNEVAEIREGVGLRVEFQGFELEAFTMSEGCFLFQSVHTKLWYTATLDQSESLQPITTGGGLKFGILSPQREIVRNGLGGQQIPAALVSILPRKSNWKEVFGKDSNAIHCAYISQIVLSTPTASELDSDAVRVAVRRPNNTQEPAGMGVVYTPQIWYIS